MSAALPSWTAAEWVLGLGALAGAVAAWACRGGNEAAPADATLDLDERLAALVAQLRDLEAQRARIEPADFAAQSSAYRARAAALMRQRQVAASTPPRRPRAQPELSPTMAFFAARPALRGALWGGGSVGMLALIYVLAHDAQTPVVTPPLAPAAAGAPAAQVDPEELHRLTQVLQAHPDDVPTLVHLAHLLMRGQMLEEARGLNDRALALAPDDVEAQVHGAVFAAATGDPQASIAALEEILRRHPEMAEAWFFRGMLSMQRGDTAKMRQSMERFVALAPPGPQRDRIAAMLAAQPPADAP